MIRIILIILTLIIINTSLAYSANCTIREDTPASFSKGDFIQMIRYESVGNLSAINQMSNQGKLFVIYAGKNVQRLSLDGRYAKVRSDGLIYWTFNSMLMCR